MAADKNRDPKKALPVGLGLVFGIVFGAVLSATTDNTAWIGIGIAFGLIFGGAASTRICPLDARGPPPKQGSSPAT